MASAPHNRAKSGDLPGRDGAGRFLHGQSGNPGGRPRNATLLSQAYERVLADMVKGGNATGAEVIARAMFKKAAKGNVGAAHEMADRVEGKPIQQVALHSHLQIDDATAARIASLAERLLPGYKPVIDAQVKQQLGCACVACQPPTVPKLPESTNLKSGE